LQEIRATEQDIERLLAEKKSKFAREQQVLDEKERHLEESVRKHIAPKIAKKAEVAAQSIREIQEHTKREIANLQESAVYRDAEKEKKARTFILETLMAQSS